MRASWIVGVCVLLAAGCGRGPATPAPEAVAAAASKVVVAETLSDAPTGHGLPVLLVHGHHGSSQNFAMMAPWLREHGFDPVAMNFVDTAWTDWSLSDLSDQVAVNVMALRRKTGQDQIDVVAHSLGGIAVRHFIKFKGGDRYIRHLVCLGTPHHGVGFASLAPGLAIATLFRPHSRELNELNRPVEAFGAVSYTNVWSTGDYMEQLPFASGRMEYTFNYRTGGTTHSGMTTDPRLFPVVAEGLLRPLDAKPGAERSID